MRYSAGTHIVPLYWPIAVFVHVGIGSLTVARSFDSRQGLRKCSSGTPHTLDVILLLLRA